MNRLLTWTRLHYLEVAERGEAGDGADSELKEKCDMKNGAEDDSYLTREQQRLLGGWRDIIDDVAHLCRSLQALPDTCACGQGASHLGGSCVCCHTTNAEQVPDCPDCDGLLAQLRPQLDGLTVDTMRFFPVVTDLLQFHAPDTAQAEGVSIERHIAGIVRTFEQLVVAADEFRAGCRASHLDVLKTRATDLLADVNRLDRMLEGSPTSRRLGRQMGVRARGDRRV